jgi:hypothetical protein
MQSPFAICGDDKVRSISGDNPCLPLSSAVSYCTAPPHSRRRARRQGFCCRCCCEPSILTCAFAASAALQSSMVVSGCVPPLCMLLGAGAALISPRFRFSRCVMRRAARRFTCVALLFFFLLRFIDCVFVSSSRRVIQFNVLSPGRKAPQPELALGRWDGWV